MKTIWYEDERFYYVRKPHGIPTVYGAQFSFLETLEQERPSFFTALADVRTSQEERGLLNRLDNDTAGLVYFAKTKDSAHRYHQQQETNNIHKIYLCDFSGDMMRYVNSDTHAMWVDEPYLQEKGLCVSYPIMHHSQDEQKMIVLRTLDDKRKWRGRVHDVKTLFVPISYNEDTNTTTAYAIINKGVRHQIRIHASSIGHALIGDVVYKGHPDKLLHLWSIGMYI